MDLKADQQPGKKIRTLIVDDSSVIRGLLTKMLEAYDFIQVVGTAADGRMGVSKAIAEKPDIVLLDIEMPEMNGLEAIPLIRKGSPHSKIIIVSSLTSSGSKTTIEALGLGAVDFVSKPSSRSLGGNREAVEKELISKIKVFGKTAYTAQPKASAAATSTFKLANIANERQTAQPKALVVGASTGGPFALMKVFESLRASYPIPIFLVQHMPPLFTRLMAERITKDSRLICHEAEDGQIAEAGKIYIAPGDFHMVLESLGSGAIKIRLNQNAPVNFCRPAVDPLFESAAAIFGSSLVGLVLTGMGEDGKLGSKAVVEAGGHVIVQDEETSVVWGMPGSVANAGYAQHILPIGEIGSFVDRLV